MACCLARGSAQLDHGTIMPSVGAELGDFQFFGWATGAFLAGAIVAGTSAGKISELVDLKHAMMMLGGATLAIG